MSDEINQVTENADPANVIARSDPKNVIARSEATRQSVDTPPPSEPPIPAASALSAREKISLAMGNITENETKTAEVINTTAAASPPPPATPATPELSERIASLEASLAQRDTSLAEASQEIETLKKDFATEDTAQKSYVADTTLVIETLKKDFATADTAHKEAIVEYRKLAVSSNPIFNPELLAGNSIPDINAAMARATNLVAKLRADVEAQFKAISIPAGAPERSGPDASGLSARDKISLAILNDKK